MRLSLTPAILSLLIVAMACSRPDAAAAKARALQQGDEFFAAYQYAESAAAYERAVRADPRDGRVRLKLAEAYRLLGRWQQAASNGIRAADLLPNDHDAQIAAVESLINLRRFEDAIARANAQLKQNPNDARALALGATATARLGNSSLALFMLGETGGSGDRYQTKLADLREVVPADQDRAAEASLRAALRLAPSSREVKIAFANFLWATRRPDEAEEMLRSAAEEAPGDGILNLAIGAYYLARNRGPEGEKYLKNAAASGPPNNRAPRQALTEYYLASNQLEKALSMLEQMAADEPGSIDLTVRVADVENRLGRHDEAMARVQAVLDRSTKHGPALLLKAQILLAAGRTAEALPTARQAVAAAPRLSEPRVTLARTLLATGDSEAAFEEYVEALRFNPASADLPVTLARLGLEIGRDRVALDYARQAARLRPDDLQSKVLVTKALLRQRDYDAADFALKPLLEHQPLTADVLVLDGSLKLARGNESGARAAFEKALKLDSGSIDAIVALVTMDLGRQQTALAQLQVDQAVSRFPKNLTLLQLASRVSAAQGHPQRAESTLRRALELQPGNVATALLLVDSLSAQNRREEAMQLLEGLLQRQPSSITAQTALGLLLEQSGRIDEAQDRYQKIINEDPGASTAAARLALLYVSRGRDLDVALSFMTAAKRLAPYDPEVSDALGWIYLQKNLLPLAKTQLEDAVRGNPRNATFQYHLGIAYSKMGQRANARQALTRALSLDRNFSDRVSAEEALSKLRD